MSARCRRLLSSETVLRVFFRVCFSAPDVSACHLLGFSRTSPLFTLAMSVVQTDAATLTCKLEIQIQFRSSHGALCPQML